MGANREIDTEIFFLGNEMEAISRFYALIDEEHRGEPDTHWGVITFSAEDVKNALAEDGSLTITKLRVMAFPQHGLLLEKLLEGKSYIEADYEENGTWISVDDLHFLDETLGLL